MRVQQFLLDRTMVQQFFDHSFFIHFLLYHSFGPVYRLLKLSYYAKTAAVAVKSAKKCHTVEVPLQSCQTVVDISTVEVSRQKLNNKTFFYSDRDCSIVFA